MNIKCELSYNSKMYGTGKAYIARILGKGEKFSFERSFVRRDVEYVSGSSTTWYKYMWEIEEEGLYEIHEQNNFKVTRKYFIYKKDEDELNYIKHDEAIKYVEK